MLAGVLVVDSPSEVGAGVRDQEAGVRDQASVAEDRRGLSG